MTADPLYRRMFDAWRAQEQRQEDDLRTHLLAWVSFLRAGGAQCRGPLSWAARHLIEKAENG